MPTSRHPTSTPPAPPARLVKNSSWRRPGLIAAALLAAAWASPAAAGEAASEPWPSRLTLEGQAALGYAPLGAYGAAVDVRLTPRFSLAAGIGVGAQGRNQIGRSLGLMPRFTAWSRGGTSLALGLGYSVGGLERIEIASTSTIERHDSAVWDPAHRLDGEISVVHRFDSGLRLRAFGGLGIVLNGPERSSQEFTPNLPPGSSYQSGPDGRLLPFAGLAIGVGAPTPGADPFPLSVRGWYGWQILAFDVPSLLVIRAYDRRYSEPVIPHGDALALSAAASVPVFFLGGPVVHLAHRHPGRAAISLLARVAVPVAIFALYVANDNEGECEGLECTSHKAALIGGALTSLTDAALLSWN